MLDFGWKRKVEHLRMVILSGAHQGARELPPGLSEILALLERVAAEGGGIDPQRELEAICRAHPDDPRLLWEPLEVYGWKVQATLYRREGALWWLVHAVRKNEREPTVKDVTLLDKILGGLGADPRRHMIIGPTSSPPGKPALPFGWWSWQNRGPLYEIQVNKDATEKIRIVPLGSRETDGYQTLDVKNGDPGE